MRRALFVVLALSSCSNDPRPPSQKPPLECELGGRFLVGGPLVVSGGCSGHFPMNRELSIVPTTPGIFETRYAGVTLLGQPDEACLLSTQTVRSVVDGHDTQLSAEIEVVGDAISAYVDITMFDLPSGESCDARYRLVGLRDTRDVGNGIGGSCNSGAECSGEVCAFGEVSACASNVCLYQETSRGDDVYCTEACDEGSCPVGYACVEVAPFVYRADGAFYCARVVPVCGDTVTEGDEICDDGGTVSGDGCAADCLSDETCGNDVVDLHEQCDGGNAVGGDGCSSTCRVEVCGNEVVDPGETCDDGGTSSNDGCSSLCRLEGCGNAELDPGEACDDGNALDTDACDTSCRSRLNDGAARIDAAFVRGLPNGASQRIGRYELTPQGGGIVVAFNEGYVEPGPFGAVQEIYVTRFEPGIAAALAPRRLAALAGHELESLVTRGDEVLLLSRSGATLFLSRSSNGGQSFAPPEAVVVDGVPAQNVTGSFGILVSDGPVLQLFIGASLAAVETPNRNLYVARSTDGGHSFGQAQRLSAMADRDGYASRPRTLVTGSGGLVVAWADGAPGAGFLYVARSLDRGATFLRAHELLGPHAAERGDETRAALALADGAVHLSFAGPDGWQAGEWHLGSDAWQMTTVAPSTVLASSSGGVAAAFGAELHVALVSGDALLTSHAEAAGFMAPVRLGRAPLGQSFVSLGDVALVRSASSLVAFFTARVGEAIAPYVVRSDDRGASFSASATQLAALDDGGAAGTFRVADGRFLALSTGTALWLFDALAVPYLAPAAHEGSAGDACAAHGWCKAATVAAPSPRYAASATYLGGKALFYGGSDGFTRFADLHAYDPATGIWTPGASAGAAPVALVGRVGHTAVVAGDELLVFGGHDGLVALADGGAYDVTTDAWRRLPSSDAPTARAGHVAVWTGNRMLVYGGRNGTQVFADGAFYDPASDDWTAIADTGVQGAYDASAAVVGDAVVVFGGTLASGQPTSAALSLDVTTGAATSLPTSSAPTARSRAALVAANDALYVFGGAGLIGPVGSGAKYAGAAWSSFATAGAPTARVGMASVWTGTRWLIWGGTSDSSGALYDPALDSWSPLPLAGAPSARSDAAAVWAGDRVLLFGGVSSSGVPLGDAVSFLP